MCCRDSIVGLGMMCVLCCSTPLRAAAVRQVDTDTAPLSLDWHNDYGQAWRRASKAGKMLLIWFRGEAPSRLRDELQQAFARDAAVRAKLDKYVLVRLPADAEITSSGAPVRLLEHAAFAEMHGHEGLAIIDLADRSRATYGRLVSAFPLMQGKFYRFRAGYLATILDLPPGTITERTMIWAVRVHPERPQSTNGAKHPTLGSEACQHSSYQARVCVQGHHRWSGRFHRIRRLLGGGATPVEVVAESWPSQTMIDSCIDCVASWRQSPGHWRAVFGRHRFYGYDIQRGRNGIWYGTGIFSGRWR